MKKFLKKCVFGDKIWPYIRVFVKPFYHCFYEGEELSKKRLLDKKRALLYPIFSSKVVLNGIFQGMVYPDFVSVGSSLFAKLLGSYERELESLFESIKNENYTEILDVGCAEGYYVVGLARIFTNAKIYAFDINPQAIHQCEKMAKLNHVEDRVILREACDEEILANFQFTGKNLIISDCEGYERFLFSAQNIHNLMKSDVLIEVHELYEYDVFTYLLDIFKNSHDFIEYKSTTDFEKMREYKYPQLENLPRDLKYEILSENREYQQSWLYFTPKKGL